MVGCGGGWGVNGCALRVRGRVEKKLNQDVVFDSSLLTYSMCPFIGGICITTYNGGVCVCG